MNYKMIWYIMGQIFKVEAVFMAVSLVVSLIYGENLFLAFGIPVLALLAIGHLLTLKKPAKRTFFAKEGFFVVGLSWFILSLFGALPFVISGQVPSFIDAFFETASGFTTTGASVISDVEALSHGLLFWRSFTHWIGGMGVLVFVLAIFPEQETQSIYLMKAESPGPKVGKIVSKLRITARILYGIYIAMTLIEFILLVCGGMSVFDSLVNSFATAGTGGFSVKNAGIGAYGSAYCEYVISAFMILFGVNFNVFYLILIGKVKDAIKSEELKVYLGVVFSSVVLISAVNMINKVEGFATVGGAARYSLFQVASIISTTGFATADFATWPTFSQVLLVILMFLGACAGSTGGGTKIARFIIMIKSGIAELKRCISPNSVISVKFEGKPLESDVLRSTNGYFVAYFSVLALSMIAVSFDGLDFTSTFTGVLACLNNIGPALSELGPTKNFASLSVLSKLVLSFDMIAGRLELFPVLLILSPKTYRK
ncbi:MAG: TrkH family potassium uptake protein [Clostridia bacterium]|nr:TrkH family potassium uptake protein [Clostridia bacterium]